jgi:hypothetical protein
MGRRREISQDVATELVESSLWIFEQNGKAMDFNVCCDRVRKARPRGRFFVCLVCGKAPAGERVDRLQGLGGWRTGGVGIVRCQQFLSADAGVEGLVGGNSGCVEADEAMQGLRIDDASIADPIEPLLITSRRQRLRGCVIAGGRLYVKGIHSDLIPILIPATQTTAIDVIQPASDLLSGL